MKVEVMFKTPDVLQNLDISNEEKNFIERYVKYGEYITIEFDTENKTVKVLEKV